MNIQQFFFTIALISFVSVSTSNASAAASGNTTVSQSAFDAVCQRLARLEVLEKDHIKKHAAWLARFETLEVQMEALRARNRDLEAEAVQRQDLQNELAGLKQLCLKLENNKNLFWQDMQVPIKILAKAAMDPLVAEHAAQLRTTQTTQDERMQRIIVDVARLADEIRYRLQTGQMRHAGSNDSLVIQQVASVDDNLDDACINDDGGNDRNNDALVNTMAHSNVQSSNDNNNHEFQDLVTGKLFVQLNDANDDEERSSPLIPLPLQRKLTRPLSVAGTGAASASNSLAGVSSNDCLTRTTTLGK